MRSVQMHVKFLLEMYLVGIICEPLGMLQPFDLKAFCNPKLDELLTLNVNFVYITIALRQVCTSQSSLT